MAVEVLDNVFLLEDVLQLRREDVCDASRVDGIHHLQKGKKGISNTCLINGSYVCKRSSTRAVVTKRKSEVLELTVSRAVERRVSSMSKSLRVI